MRQIIAVICMLCSLVGVSQSDTLFFDSVQTWVKDHHPVIRSLAYRIDGADAKVLAAQGAFDLYLSGDYSEKQFEGTEYYQYGQAGLKLPTWLGVDVYAYRAFAEGVYLNPQNNQPDDGLWKVGLSVPVGGDLIWDERRAMLRDAQLVRTRTEAEQRLAFSDVMYEVNLRYLEWALSEAEYRTYREVELLAEERFNWLKRAYETGDRPAMDTVESRIQWFNRKLKREEAQGKAAKARAYLSAMLWTDNGVPLEIPDHFHPDLAALDFLMPVDSATIYGQLADQPQVAALTVEVDRALNQRRWSRAQLWPEINVNYNFLRGGAADAEWSIPDQYQWGVQLNVPLFLRKARGTADAADAKYEEAELKKLDAIQKAEAELRALRAEARILSRQWLQAQEVYVMSQTLLDAERRRFLLGESSVFLVNSRENAMVNAAVTWLNIRKEYRLVQEKQKRLVASYWEE